MKKYLLILGVIFNYSISIFNCYSQWIQTNDPTDRSILSFAEFKDIIFMGASLYGVYVSSNEGTTWQLTSLNDRTVFSLAVKDSIIYAGTEYMGIYKSTNSGVTWSQIGLSNKYVYAIATSGNNIYAGTYNYPAGSGGIWLSTNEGYSWEQIGLSSLTVRSIVVSGNYIFAGTVFSGVWRSTNNGANWDRTPIITETVFSLAMNNNTLFAGTAQSGIFVSTNYGTNWLYTSLGNKCVYSIAAQNNNVIAGVYNVQGDGGVWFSSNNGLNWIQKNDGFIQTPTVNALLITQNYLFAGTDLKSVWRRARSELMNVKNTSDEIPLNYALYQNYPNPFNSTTKIVYQVPKGSLIVIKIFDVRGKEINTLVNEYHSPGTYEVEWNTRNLQSGIYFYRLTSGNFSKTKSMTLIK